MTESVQDCRPRVLVAHQWVGPRRALAAYLAHLRPALAVAEVAPEDLGAALGAYPPPIVLCDMPSAAVERLALGWIAVAFDGPPGAVAGMGSCFRPMAGDEIEDILSTIDELIAGTWIGELHADGRSQAGLS